MLRRIFATVLVVLGLAIAGAGYASGTIWRADETVTATLPQDPQAPVVVAGGNVLATVNPNVTVTLTAPDANTPLVLAMGREADVLAWLGDSPYEQVTGLTDWETLTVESPAAGDDATEDPSASDDPSATEDASESASAEPTDEATDEGGEDAPADATVPNPAGSDLWIEEVTGTGELTYEWSQVDGRWMMLVATDGTEPAPTVSMTWTREVTTPLMVPGLIIGGVIFLIGLVWLIIELLVRREERRARRRGAEDETSPTVATTDADGAPLTRRQIREAARAGKGGAAAGAGTTTVAGSAEDTASTATPAEGTDTGSADDWTAIISGGPGETTDQDPEAAQPPQEAETSSANGATDLDDWVRSGRTGAEAGPVSTYESPAPGRGLGGEHTGTPGATWRGTDDAAEPAGDGAAAEPEPKDRPRRWWQRRAKSESAPELPEESAAASSADPTEDAVPPGADEASEANPQASGASWRQTWGLTPERPSGAQASEPATDADDSAADDSGDDEEVDR